MSATTGIVLIRRKGKSIAFPIEVHAEDADSWSGYNRINPFGGYQTFAKASYEVVEDRRDD